MPKGVRSARGQMVDFDLLKIKQQIASAPPSADVKARENFIDSKYRRRLKRAQRQVSDKLATINVEKPLPKAEEAAPPENV